MPSTIYTNNGFRRGLWDDDFRHAVTKDGFNEALLEALNVTINDSGAVRRRPNFFKKTGFSTAAWAANASTFSVSDEMLLIPFTSQRSATGNIRWILVVQRNPADNTQLWIVPFNVDDNTFDSRLTMTNTVMGFGTNVRDYQYVQAGPSLFIATRPGLYFDTTPGIVVRIYDDGAGALVLDGNGATGCVEFHHELSGLWYYIAGGGTVAPNNNGTTNDQMTAGTTNAPTDGVSDAANFAPAENEITASHELWLPRSVTPDSGNWCNIASVDDELGTASGVPFLISITDPANPIHVSQFTPKYRQGTVANRQQCAAAISFYEGRLVLGNTQQSYLPLNHEQTRMLFSAIFDPYLIYPSVFNGFPDSPIDATVFSPQMDTIKWLCGSHALFVGGNRGLTVIRPGITQTPQQVPIDSLGCDSILPIVEQSGIIYQSADGYYLTRVDYFDGNAGYKIKYLNELCQKQVNNAIRLQLGTGYTSCPRCIYAILEDGTMAVGHIFADEQVSWVLYDTEMGDIIDIVALDSDVYALVDSGSGLALFLLDENDDYAGDNQETAALSGGRWKLADSGNFSAKVAVTATIDGGDRVHLGVFGTDASGYITDGSMDLDDLYDTLTSVVCFRTFESIVTPTPAIATSSEGTSLGLEQRLVRARVGYSNTRNFNLNNKLAFKHVNLDAVQAEREQGSGFVRFEGGNEHGLELVDTITADGAHQFIITQLVREVGA